MPFVVRQDASIHFEDKGSGACVLFAHSFLCSGAMWAPQVEVLSQAYRTVNVDARGHGQSGAASPGVDLYDLVDDHLAVLDDLGVGSAVWAGLSMGGMIALRAALVAPERVRALVLADTSAAAEPSLPVLRYRAMGLGARWLGLQPFVGRVGRLMFGPTTHRRQPELVASWGRRFAGAHRDSILELMKPLFDRDSLLDRLSEIRVPTLVLVGEEDSVQPLARARQIVDGIAGAELVTIPEAGHLIALEQPEVVTQTIRDFLAEVLPR